METRDLAAVLALQAQAYAPCFHEPEAAFRGKLERFPEWAWIAQEPAGKLLAYLFAQPARFGEPPGFGDGGTPVLQPEALHLHDLAVLPEARGAGLADLLASHVLDLGRQAPPGGSPFKWATLIAVQGSLPYWSRLGFAPGPASATLAGYGPDAAYLVRIL